MKSDYEIDDIIERAREALKHNKVPVKWHRNFLLSLRGGITKPGLIKNVCHRCMGSGYNTPQVSNNNDDIKKYYGDDEKEED